MKPDKLLCDMFLFAFLALTLHKQQWSWNVLEQLTNQNVFVKMFNCGVSVKTKDCAGSHPF